MKTTLAWSFCNRCMCEYSHYSFDDLVEVSHLLNVETCVLSMYVCVCK